MKKAVITFIFLFIFFPFNSLSIDNLSSPIIILNDDLIYFEDVYPVIKCGITFVPIRGFANSIGGNVKWDNENKVAIISKGDKNIKIDFSNDMIFTDEGSCIVCNMYLNKNRIMIPFKLIANYFGYDVTYIESENVIRAKDENIKLSDQSIINKLKSKIEKERRKIALLFKNKRIAYITFDDGPSIYTQDILDILQKYKCKATFFVLSNHIKKYPDEVEKIVEEGHSIGLHGVSHDVKKIYSSPDSVVSEMNEDNEVLFSKVGFKTNIIRTPYGSFPYMTKEYRDACIKEGYKMWDWNVDSKDAFGFHVNPNVIIDNVINQVKSHKINETTPIILMHEMPGTVKALPKILKYLQENGYTVVPINYNEKPINFWNDMRE